MENGVGVVLNLLVYGDVVDVDDTQGSGFETGGEEHAVWIA